MQNTNLTILDLKIHFPRHNTSTASLLSATLKPGALASSEFDTKRDSRKNGRSCFPCAENPRSQPG